MSRPLAMMMRIPTTLLAAVIAGPLALGQSARSLNDDLWVAAQAGDLVRITQALERGAEVNAKTDHGITALWFAADRGHLGAVQLLIDRGAELHVHDIRWAYLPLDRALINGHLDVARYLLERGSRGAAGALTAGIRARNVALVKSALSASDLDVRAVASALQAATQAGDAEIMALVKAAVAAFPVEAVRAVTVDPATLQSYAGSYSNASKNLTLTVTTRNGQLIAESFGQPRLTLIPTGPATFRAAEIEAQTFAFAGQDSAIDRMTFTAGPTKLILERVATTDQKTAPAGTSGIAHVPANEAGVVKPRTEARNWPSFRGPAASGIGDGQDVVVDWDVDTGRNIKWKTPIPGIANSSPIVWGDRVFVTTAIGGDTTFRTGQYRDLRPVDDVSEHSWKIYALDKSTGHIVWERDVFRGRPAIKRHPKASQANSTPVTDGRHVVAVFGSMGLVVCYDMTGKLLWKKNLGPIDSGAAWDATYQYGHASSPIIYKHLAIVQADQQKGSFLAAYRPADRKGSVARAA